MLRQTTERRGHSRRTHEFDSGGSDMATVYGDAFAKYWRTRRRTRWPYPNLRCRTHVCGASDRASLSSDAASGSAVFLLRPVTWGTARRTEDGYARARVRGARGIGTRSVSSTYAHRACRTRGRGKAPCQNFVSRTRAPRSIGTAARASQCAPTSPADEIAQAAAHATCDASARRLAQVSDVVG